MRGERPAGKAGHAVENLIGSAGPDEWFRIFVVDLDESANGRLKLFDAAERAAPDPFVGEFGEPSLHQVQPGAVCGREVNVKTGPLEQPVPDESSLVRAVVIQNQVHVQLGGNLRLDRVQKPAELDRTMALVKLADYVTGFQIEGGEQGSRPVPLIVMSAALQLTRLHG